MARPNGKLGMKPIEVDVRYIILDTRGITMQAELIGKMTMPDIMFKAKAENDFKRIRPDPITHHIDEMATNPKGVITDICGTTCNVVFPFMQDEHCKDLKGRSLTFDDIVDLFIKSEGGRLKVHSRGVKGI